MLERDVESVYICANVRLVCLLCVGVGVASVYLGVYVLQTRVQLCPMTWALSVSVCVFVSWCGGTYCKHNVQLRYFFLSSSPARLSASESIS